MKYSVDIKLFGALTCKAWYFKKINKMKRNFVSEIKETGFTKWDVRKHKHVQIITILVS